MADTKPGAPEAQTGHDAGGHKAGFPPFDSQTFPSQLLWFVVAFGALYLLMSKIALPRVGAALGVREDTIAGDLDRAASAQKQADDASKAYDKTLADARARAQAMGQDAAAKAAAETDARRKALEGELNVKLAAAEAQIAAAKVTAMGNVDQIARDAAASIVERLTGIAAPADAIASAVASAKS